ncbi:MAG: response regulator [Pontiellaceae bacterium]|nr:response regulator [Pontiellaceae bacterium]
MSEKRYDCIVIGTSARGTSESCLIGTDLAMRRSRDPQTDIPIIALTDESMKEDRAKCIKAGANDYLSKPVKMDKLLSLMRVWLTT